MEGINSEETTKLYLYAPRASRMADGNAARETS